MAKNTTITFHVTGEEKLHCTGCVQRVGNALRRVPGIREVQADYQTQEIRVGIDPAEISADAVQEKLALLGYEVQREAGTRPAAVAR